MKAAIFKKYGGPQVVTIKDIPTPTPKPNEVLIQTTATTVSSGDARIRSLNVPRGFGIMVRLMFGIFKPRKQILGSELSGVITAVGEEVTQFKVKDAVIAFPGANMGAHAEFVALAENAPIILKPDCLDFEQAAALAFGGTTALDFLKNKAHIQTGERILINGASGTVGLAAIQIAKHFGAHVTAVCSAPNHKLVESLGADAVVDYQHSDFTQSETSWDIIMDIVGTAPWRKSKNVLNKNGRFLMIVADFFPLLSTLLSPKKNGQKAFGGSAKESVEDLQALARLTEQGAFKPIIDSTYKLTAIQSAHQRVDTRHKCGSVVVSMHVLSTS